MAQSHPSDIGLSYIVPSYAPQHNQDVPLKSPPGSPVESAMKLPGTFGANIDKPLPPLFQEEQILEQQEELTEKEQARDLKAKLRVRIAKFILRGVSFSCSLIVLAMVSMTLSIFNATKALAPRNNLPAWAAGTDPWPQKVIIAVSCVSLAFCLIVFWSYFRGGHEQAEKISVYYTLFVMALFIFSVVMWCVAAGFLQGVRSSSGKRDIWGWSCVDNTRRELFSKDVDYALICRMQNWLLGCCIIEIVFESVTFILYGAVFYRYYTKQRLRKSMDIRDRARSNLYLAQLRSSTTPKSPNFNPSMHAKLPDFGPSTYVSSPAMSSEHFAGPETVEAEPASAITAMSSALRPINVHSATGKPPKTDFTHASLARMSGARHVRSACEEQTYDVVPIPMAYASLLRSSGRQQPASRGLEVQRSDHE